MALLKIKKYDLKGKEIGEVSIDDEFLQTIAHPQMVKDYLIAVRNNGRQWCASTKIRSEVCHSTQKPHRQKGTGKARQGFLGAPQYKGGGRVFGPRPKFDQHVKVNKKEKQSVIRSLLSEKIKEQKVSILSFDLKEPKTKKMAAFLEKVGMLGNRVLFLTSKNKLNEVLLKSLQNIPKKELLFVNSLNGYDLALCKEIIIMDPAVDEFKAILEVK